MNEKDCVLWENAKDLASDRGFTLSDTCPMINVCRGTRCVYMSDSAKIEELKKELQTQIEKQNA